MNDSMGRSRDIVKTRFDKTGHALIWVQEQYLDSSDTYYPTRDPQENCGRWEEKEGTESLACV